MRLPRARRVYDPASEDGRSQLIEAADRQNHKRGQDIEVGEARLILTSPNGTRYALSVTNLGMLTVDAI